MSYTTVFRALACVAVLPVCSAMLLWLLAMLLQRPEMPEAGQLLRSAMLRG